MLKNTCSPSLATHKSHTKGTTNGTQQQPQQQQQQQHRHQQKKRFSSNSTLCFDRIMFKLIVNYDDAVQWTDIFKRKFFMEH